MPSRAWRIARSSGCRSTDLEGRDHQSCCLTPYPPGIPLLIPGRALQRHHRALPQVRARLQCRASPGFETDIHGLVKDGNGNGEVDYYVDGVRAGA
jgi:arginine/lysine/ornithine decarboxylase